MRHIALAAALTLAGCAADVGPTTTDPKTQASSAPSTTAPMELEITGCATPPVTFSALCEVYQLLQEWHVDRPLDPSVLARLAINALTEAESRGPAPSFLQCSIPDPEFTEFCVTLDEVGGPSEPDRSALVDKAVTSMVDGALGPFTFYVPPQEVPHIRADGVVGGIGVVLDSRDAAGSRCARLAPECPLEVVYVLDGAPADIVGIQTGDVITAIDGVGIEGEGFASVSRRLAGDETGEVSLTIDRGGRLMEVVIERQPVTGGAVEVGLPRAGVGYLRIPDFSEQIPELVHEGLTALAGHSPNIVLVDLRDNGGGTLDAVTAVASEFIGEGTVVRLMGQGDERVEEASPGGLALQPRLVVLVNRGTASAAEILAGALRDRRGAIVVGEATFGKDAVQIPFDLRNGGRLHVVVARWATPNGHTVAEAGLPPDIELNLETDLTVEELTNLVLGATE